MTVCRICQHSGQSFSVAAEGGVGGNPRRIGFPPTNQNVQPLLLTTGEAGALLGIGRTKVFEMLATGELPAVRIGRCVRGISSSAGSIRSSKRRALLDGRRQSSCVDLPGVHDLIQAPSGL